MILKIGGHLNGNVLPIGGPPAKLARFNMRGGASQDWSPAEIKF